MWDLPTRLFHWTLVALVVVSWLTGEDEGTAALVHRLSGEAIAGLVVFRVAWGFLGGEHARFASFLKGPGPVSRHLGHLLRGRAEPTLGHNPLGGLSVLVLLASVSAVVITGLFSAGDEGPSGPLAGRFGLELSAYHEPAFRLLQAVVVLHLLGVIVTSWASRENLVRAMITGSKRRGAEVVASPVRRGSTWALALAVGLGAASAAFLMRLPPSSAGDRGAHAQGAAPTAAGAAREADDD